MGRRARLFVLSGPSGCGKGTVLKEVMKERPELGLAVSATTREPREGEIDGISYHFISKERFLELVAEDAFLEHAAYSDNLYGTLNSEVDSRIAKGSSVILEIEVQGAFAVRERRPDAVLVFIEPPSMEELERRLRSRGTEDEEKILKRLARAREEMELSGYYDALIVNDDLGEAVAQMLSLIDRYETDGGTDQDGSH